MTITGPITTQAEYRILLDAINDCARLQLHDERKRLIDLAKDFAAAQRARGHNPATWNRKEFGL